MTSLYWLTAATDWREKLTSLRKASEPWPTAVKLASTNLDFIQTNQLDGEIRNIIGIQPPADLETKPIRLAILSSCTMAHLHGGIRIAGIRRGLHIQIYEADYGQYWRALTEREAGLDAFAPNVVLFALDARHLAAGVNANMLRTEADAALREVQTRLRECWRIARENFNCAVIQQTPLQVFPSLLGNNEHRLPSSKAAFIKELNLTFRAMADQAGVDLLAVDDWAARDGLAAWHDNRLWHRAKQEISPAVAPLYGDLVGRILAAQQGRQHKCLVLDLDNTLWGGVVGDDGPGGIVIGQGSALGEAYTAFQEYVRDLKHRGIILAVSSKNDELNAFEVFDTNPEMTLRRKDFACIVANWSDKADNLRTIAKQLNIGVDSLVFADDNPFERNLVRQELAMVAVPELGDDPTNFAQTLADAGYFESMAVTNEDRERSIQYKANLLREELRASNTDLPAYLRSLSMQLIWQPFDQVGLSRIVQLINKTNQFNLTTRRYTTADILGIMRDNRAFGLQLRLLDRFGDNGIIAIIIGKVCADESDGDLVIDTWLMSCRVLGRQVEPTMLNLAVEQARILGARRLVGEYLPTKKNGMVRDHYEKLGFGTIRRDDAGRSKAVLDIATFRPLETFIEVMRGPVSKTDLKRIDS